MKAAVMTAAGGPEVLELQDIAAPTCGPDQVLVAVKAASVNPIDTKIRSLGLPIGPEVPAPLGCDMAGVVLAVGDQVSGFSAGEEVYGCVGGVTGQGGTYAEQIAVDPALLGHKPKTLSFREAASLPLVTITAYEALFDRAKIKRGDHILIHGGTGGVGHIAVQLAHLAGARVSTTVSSEEKAALARSFGADDIIFYKDEPTEAYVDRLTGGRGFDIVFDATGGSDLPNTFAGAKAGGQVVIIVARFSADLSLMHAKALSLHMVFMLIPMISGEGRAAHGKIMQILKDHVDAGELRPLIDEKRYTLETVADAHNAVEAGEALGKVVIDIAE